MRKAGILKNMGILAATVRAQTTTFRTRKNGAGNGNLSVPITGGGALDGGKIHRILTP